MGLTGSSVVGAVGEVGGWVEVSTVWHARQMRALRPSSQGSGCRQSEHLLQNTCSRETGLLAAVLQCLEQLETNLLEE